MKIILPYFEYIGLDYEGDMLFECRHIKNKKCGIYEKRSILCSSYPTEMIYKAGRMIEGCGYYFVEDE